MEYGLVIYKGTPTVVSRSGPDRKFQCVDDATFGLFEEEEVMTIDDMEGALQDGTSITVAGMLTEFFKVLVAGLGE